MSNNLSLIPDFNAGSELEIGSLESKVTPTKTCKKC